MHPINKILNYFGLKVQLTNKNSKYSPNIPVDFKNFFEVDLDRMKKNKRGFKVFEAFSYDGGNHPVNYIDYECEFAASCIKDFNPISILDIGSYRHFILGLLANYDVTTIDIRKRESMLINETILTTDSKELEIPSDTFDAIVSLCSLEHFGLGRYGDDFDIDADIKTFDEMRRVLKPGGKLIFSTTITRSAPSIAFNRHRIYNKKMIDNFVKDMEMISEKFYSRTFGKFVSSYDEITSLPNNNWDVYCGCYKKC